MLPVLWDRGEVRRRRQHTQLRLAELLDTVAPTTQLLLDLKGFDPRLATRLLSAVEARPDLGRRLIVCARNWQLLRKVELHAPEIRVFRSVRTPRALAALWKGLAAGDVPDGVSVHVDLIDRRQVGALSAAGLRVITWPVNDAQLATRLVDWGVDGLISDEYESIQACITMADSHA